VKHWSAAFVGLPWCEKGRDREGIDCWGLIALVYAEALGRTLPSYAERYSSIEERTEVSALLAGGASKWPWQPVAPGRERAFDVALFRRGRIESHVGVVVNRGQMLHVLPGSLSCIESYAEGRWWPRLLAIYRHADVENPRI
jgi:cell wall-associated NlpC family hydrolase